jgi:methionine sulfoxide reductase heme-binding subunit
VTSETAWLIARAGGLVAYGLLTLTVVLGIVHSGRRVRSVPRFAVEDVHRFLSILTALFLGLHGVGLLLDDVVPFSVRQLVVPFTADISPLWTGLGVVAAELLLALSLTNLFRARLAHRTWRRLHALAFPVWILATAHGLLAGTDTDQWWAMGLYAYASALTIGLLGWRIAATRTRDGGVAAGALAGLAAALVALTLAVAPQVLGGHGIDAAGSDASETAAAAGS